MLSEDQLNAIIDRRRVAVDWWAAPGDDNVSSWDRAKANYKFYAGRGVFTSAEVSRAKKREQALVYFNTVAPKINSLTAQESVSPFEPILKGLEDQDKHLAELVSAWIHKVWKSGNFDAEDAEAFLDLFVCGYACSEVWRDPFEPVPKQLRADNLYPWSVAVDPIAKGRNLQDRWFDFRFTMMRKEEAERFFPLPEQRDKLRDVRDAAPMDASRRETDLKDYRRDAVPYYKEKGIYRIDHHEWKEPDDRFYTADGQEIEDFDDFVEDFTARSQVQAPPTRGVDYYQQEKYRYVEAWLVGSYELDSGDIPCFRRAYMTAWPFKDQTGTRFFSPVDMVRDPARWSSKAKSLLIDHFSVSPKAPWLAERGAFETDQEIVKAAQPSKAVILKDGALSGPRPKIVPLRAPSFPPYGQLVGMFMSDVWETLGVSPAGLGQIDDVRRVAGRSLQQLRQLTLAPFAKLYESLRLFRAEEARIMLKMTGEHFTIQDVIGIVGRQGLPLLEAMADEQKAAFLGGGLKGLIDRALVYDVVADEKPEVAVEADQFLEVLPQLLGVLQQEVPPPLWPWVLDIFEESGLIKHERRRELEAGLNQWIQIQMQQQQLAALPEGAGAQPTGEPS